MPARVRSGPRPDPNSGNSERRGLTFTTLPNEGYDGPIPRFELPVYAVFRWEYEDKKRYQVVDAAATEDFTQRETDLWNWAWRTPQACAWIVEPWRWQTISMWARVATLCETSAATSSDRSSMLRLADQIGLTPAGLKENGWSIALPQIARPASAPAEDGELREQRQRRMRDAAA